MGLVCCQQGLDSHNNGPAALVHVEPSRSKGPTQKDAFNNELVEIPPPGDAAELELIPSSLEPIKLAEIPHADALPAQCLTVTISKSSKSEKLGLDLTHCKQYLLVGRIYPNLAAARHNEEASGEKVLVGDKIIEVNGVRGRDEDMVMACKDEAVVQLKVMRRPTSKR
mmetsp:Transcript_68513/g.164536  ORF Transcript_68513/g.164536 Transcript_68513/m.164536 type:complete len:168 (+) Transcript_68513:87-590(+)